MQKRRQHISGRNKQPRRPRSNGQIRTDEVLLVTEEGNKRMPTSKALALAQEEGLDLIEVTDKANPPVVKIADMGQHLYQLKKKQQKQKAGSKQRETKTLRMSFRTESHDLDRIKDKAIEFFKERHMVKLVIQLRGRELTNKQYAREKLAAVAQDLIDKEVAEEENPVRAQGNQFIVLLRAAKK